MAGLRRHALRCRRFFADAFRRYYADARRCHAADATLRHYAFADDAAILQPRDICFRHASLFFHIAMAAVYLPLPLLAMPPPR